MYFKKLAVAISTLLYYGASVAQEEGGIDLGGFELIPSIDIVHELDDNIARSATVEVDSWKRIFSPEAVLLNNFYGNTLQFGYKLERGDYFSSSQDNYTDHFVSALLDYEFNGRHRAKTTFDYEDGHNDRGTSFSIGTGDTLASPDTYKQLDGDIVYSYGALTADARIDVSLGYTDLDYDRSEEIYLRRERDISSIAAIFYYRIAPATDLLVDYSNAQVSYNFTAGGIETLDSTNSSLLVGVEWESSAATTGFAKIGYQEKDFDSALRDKFNGFDWEVGMSWQPFDRSTIDFATQSETNETNGEGNFIKRHSYNAIWNHEWLARISSRVSLAFVDDVYDGSVNSRQDDITELRLSLDYQFKRWLTLDASYQYEERESNIATIDYGRNVFSIGVRVTL